MTSTTELGEVEFRIDPRARRISLLVCPARRRIVLTAPSQRREREAYAFLRSRQDWAARQLRGLPPAAPFRPGVEILLRGDPVTLRPAEGRGPVRLDEGAGAMDVPGRPDAFAGRVRRFLRAEAKADLAEALARHCAALDRPAPPLTLRDTRTRWGSCGPDGRLNFSWRLICAPRFVLDFVAGHEAAHLVHHNHGARFRALERKLVPRCEDAGAWLAANGPALHAVGAEA